MLVCPRQVRVESTTAAQRVDHHRALQAPRPPGGFGAVIADETVLGARELFRTRSQPAVVPAMVPGN